MVEDLEAEKKFIVDMNISVCLNKAKGTPCEIVLKVLEKMYLPKIGCDWNVGNNFSTSDFLSNLGLSLSGQITDIVVKQVMEKLGIAPYLLDPQCDVASSKYQPQPDVVGWKIGMLL